MKIINTIKGFLFGPSLKEQFIETLQAVEEETPKEVAPVISAAKKTRKPRAKKV